VRLRRPEPKKARIEIIPMIDTIFFLLVFFMIASLSMTKMTGMPVQLPTPRQGSSSATSHPAPVAKVMVTVTAAGQYYIDKECVEFEGLYGEMRRRLRRNPKLVVILNCDKTQKVDKLIQVMDEVKRANAENVLIATEPKTQDGGGMAQ
jgi:biopolymer transport protein ExbD